MAEIAVVHVARLPLGAPATRPRSDDPEAHFIEHAAETAGTVTMTHELPGEQ